MATSEELAAKRASIEKLRQQIADTEAKRFERETAATNDITMRQLEAEETRLKAELALARDDASASSVRESNADLLSTVRDDQKAASDALKSAQAQNSGQGA